MKEIKTKTEAFEEVHKHIFLCKKKNSDIAVYIYFTYIELSKNENIFKYTFV